MEKAEVFISYHTRTGAEAVQRIVASLEERGIRCWYAPRDVGANYAQSIVEAIRDCRIFLLVLNASSNTSAHVLNEINCAFDRFKEHEDIVLLPFRIDGCELSDDVYYYLGRIHIMDGALPPEEIRIRELVGRVSAVLGKKAAREGKSAAASLDHQVSEKRTYRLISSMVYPDNCFIGREREQREIAECLSGVENKVFLVGMGGIGKSEIARMYLKGHAKEYDIILWIAFSGSLAQTIASDSLFAIQGMERKNYPEDDDETYFRRKLLVLKEITDRRVLIVMDNFDVEEDPDLEEFCGGPYSVIFTTRCHQRCGRIAEIEISRMSEPEELMAMFQAGYTRRLTDTARASVEEILNYLDGHPLSIRLVASTMQSRRIAPEKMADILKEGTLAAKSENAPAANMIFGHLREVFKLSTLSVQEQFLLKNLSLAPLGGISVEQFFAWCEMEDYDVIDGLIGKNWVIHNPITDEVHLHPLIGDLMREELKQTPKICDAYIRNLTKACTNTFNTDWEGKQRLLDYTRAAMERAPEDPDLLVMIWLARASMLQDAFSYDESCRMYQKALDCTRRMEERTRLYHHLSHTQILSGWYEQGLATARAGLAELEDTPLGEMSRELGFFHNELLRRVSEANRNMGNYEEAIRYARRAVKECEGFYITDQESDQGWAEYHLARSLYESGELTESEETIRHAYSLFDKADNEWSKEHCYELLGQILMKKKRFEEALSYTQKGLEIQTRLYGEDLAMANLAYQGNIYLEWGQPEKAREYLSQAARGYHKCGCFKLEERIRQFMEERL